jgi:rhomboid protease GluP
MMNVFVTMIFGFIVENYYGSKLYVAVFLISGIFGNAFSMIFNVKKVYSGASASTYGLSGMQLLYIIEHYNYMGEDRKN